MVATFADEHTLREAAGRLHAHGLAIHDIYTPYPVHGLDRLMGIGRSRLPIASFVAGVCGLAIALGFQFYVAVFDWPLDVGGKPANSTLAFVPITFEITVLCAGLGGVAAFLARTALFPRWRMPRPADGATEDRFTLVCRLRPPAADDAARLLIGTDARDVTITRAP
jgi:hypothetical protein